eukprot:2798057-Rhodomonas_salina.3
MAGTGDPGTGPYPGSSSPVLFSGLGHRRRVCHGATVRYQSRPSQVPPSRHGSLSAAGTSSSNYHELSRLLTALRLRVGQLEPLYPVPVGTRTQPPSRASAPLGAAAYNYY